MTDLFTETRKTLAAQAAARDALAARVAARQASATLPVPTSYAQCGPRPKYITPAEQAARQDARAAIRAARLALVQRHRDNTAARHGAAHAATATVRSAQYLWLVWKNDSRQSLSYGLRDLVKWVRSSEVKAALPFGEIAALPVPGENAKPSTSKPWRGLVNGTEVRVNTRGAYGKRGIKAAAERVTQRDNHVPVPCIKPLPHVVVGVATHPAATHADYAALLHTIRQRPTLSTYRALRGPVWPAASPQPSSLPVWADKRYVARTQPVGALQDCGVVPVYADTAEPTRKRSRSAAKPTRAARDIALQAGSPADPVAAQG
jgi:hypothetical protein